MFANLKTSTKVVGGFGVLLMILAGLGMTGYVMFSRVDTNVTGLTDHSLAAVKNSTGVERAAFETILQEKSYLLDKKDEAHAKAKKNLAELAGSLDRVDKIAEQFSDADLAKKSKDVRGLAAQYGKLYDQGVAALKNNTAGEQTMDAKGTLVGNEAAAYMAAKKTEYLEATRARTIVNDINGNALEARLNAQKYMLYKEQKYFDNIEKYVRDLLLSYDELEKLHPDTAEQKQIADARKATKDYLEAAKKWVATYKTTTAAGTVMENAYAVVMKNYADFMADKEKDYRAAKTDDARKAGFEMTTQGAVVADYANAAVIHSKKYMLDGRAEDWKGVTDNVDSLLKALAGLRKLATDDTDRKAIDATEKATQEYLAAAKSWVESDRQSKEAAATMAATGDTVGAAALAYRTAKAAKVNKMAEAVFIVADIANEANTTRLNEKGYILTQDQKYWAGLNEHITKLGTLYKDLRKVSLTQEDQQRIDRAEAATQEYLVAAKSWVDNDTKLRTSILPEMKKGGETVLATAQTAENDAWKASDDAGITVRGIVGTSKMLIVSTLVAGVLVVMVLGFFISRSISKMLGTLIGETKRLSEATVEGKLQTRGNPELVSLEFRPIIDGTNRLIDAFVAPINVTAEYVDRISKGDMPPKITDVYQGDFNEIKNNLNQCIDAVSGMIAEAATLSTAAVEGRLDVRAEDARFQGQYREIIQGLNKTLEGFAAPMRDIGQVLTRLARKDFTQAVDKEFPGAYGELRDNVNLVVKSIRGAVEQISESANQFAEGSRVIAESSQSLASGSQEQSSSVQQVTASIEELSRSVQGVKDNAHDADKVSRETSQLAEQGGQAVRKSAEAMELIRTSSDQIAEIIQVISEIASQTNLLALNAAIEAARAGEHGMGFAVVADEVRKLAERSNQAAGKITSLIKESGGRVQEGAQLSRQTEESLKKIVAGVEATAAKIGEIATATIQQASNADEVSKAIQGISQVTEQSAAGSEEMASSSEQLGAQAQALRDLVGQFQTGNGTSSGLASTSSEELPSQAAARNASAKSRTPAAVAV